MVEQLDKAERSLLAKKELVVAALVVVDEIKTRNYSMGIRYMFVHS